MVEDIERQKKLILKNYAKIHSYNKRTKVEPISPK